MTDRNKLSDLLYEASQKADSESYIFDQIADYLIAHGVTVQEWIPFTEPPKKMKPVICLYENEDGTQVGGGYVNDHGIWTLIAPAKGTITHWKPLNLPQPPKGE